MTTAAPDLKPILAELFRRHGVEAVADGEWVHLPASRIKVNAGVVREDVHPSSRVVQLDVRMRVGLGRVIVESFAGVGATREEAVRDSLENFTRGSFHVLLRALVAPAARDEQVTQEEWVVGGRPRRVTVGGIAIRGRDRDLGGPILDCYREFERRVKEAEFPDGIHWVRLCYVQSGSERLACEVLRDNETWGEFQTAMESVLWPAVEEFYSARVFLVLQGGPEVSRAADAIVRHPHLEDEPLIDALIAEGFSPAAAERAVVFIPTAFGHVLTRRMGGRTPGRITLRRADGDESREVALADESVYVGAVRLAEDYFERGVMSREEFEAVAFRSAAFNVLNAALAEGSRLEDLEPSGSLAFLDRLEPLDPSEELLPRPAAAPARSHKLWWRFWR